MIPRFSKNAFPRHGHDYRASDKAYHLVRNQRFSILLLTESQIPQVKDDFAWLSMNAIPILDDQILPTIWPAAVLGNIGMEEMGVGYQPGIFVDRKRTIGLAWKQSLVHLGNFLFFILEHLFYSQLIYKSFDCQ